MQIKIPSSFIFKENYVFIEEEDKVVIVAEELHVIDIDDVGNLVDLPRLMFIGEECGNLKVTVDGGVLTRNISRKKMLNLLQANRCPPCEKRYR